MASVGQPEMHFKSKGNIFQDMSHSASVSPFPPGAVSLGWSYSQAVYFSFFVICPVSLLLGTQIAVNRQG